MKKTTVILVFTIILISRATFSFAQLPVEIRSGLIYINDGTIGKPTANKYYTLTDSLDKVLKFNPNDTTCLYLRAVLYLRLNNMIANPDPGNKNIIDNMVTAKNMVVKAFANNMQNFNLKVLRAEIYRELTFRLGGDESWKYNSRQIAERKRKFNYYRELANKYYDELAVWDSNHANDYQKLKVINKYPF